MAETTLKEEATHFGQESARPHLPTSEHLAYGDASVEGALALAPDPG